MVLIMMMMFKFLVVRVKAMHNLMVVSRYCHGILRQILAGARGGLLG